MTQVIKMIKVCLLGLALVASSLPGTAGAEADRTNRKLLQGGYRDRSNMPNLNANTVRAQAATSQVSRLQGTQSAQVAPSHLFLPGWPLASLAGPCQQLQLRIDSGLVACGAATCMSECNV